MFNNHMHRGYASLSHPLLHESQLSPERSHVKDDKLNVLREAAKNVSSFVIDDWIAKFSKNEEHHYIILAVMLQAIKAAFEIPVISICRDFVLSLGELVGVVEYAQTLHFPHHTQEERDFFIAFRSICRKRLDLFQKTNTNSERPNTTGTQPHPQVIEVIDGLKEFTRLSELKKGFILITLQQLGKTIDAWQHDGLMMLWHLVEKGYDMKHSLSVSKTLTKAITSIFAKHSAQNTRPSAGWLSRQPLAGGLSVKLEETMLSPVRNGTLVGACAEAPLAFGERSQIVVLGRLLQASLAPQSAGGRGSTRPTTALLADSEGEYHVPFAASASKQTLAAGLSPKFWLDPLSNIYLFVPTNPAVGVHPKRQRPTNAKRNLKEHLTQPQQGPKTKRLTDNIERLTKGRLSTPRDQLEMFARVRAHTRSRMSEGDELWAQVVKLQHNRPHTARHKTSSADAKATAQDFEPRTAQVGKEMISMVGHAGVTGKVPIPTDGSRPRPSTSNRETSVTNHQNAHSQLRSDEGLWAATPTPLTIESVPVSGSSSHRQRTFTCQYPVAQTIQR